MFSLSCCPVIYKIGRSVLVKGTYRRSVVNTFQTYGYGILPEKVMIIYLVMKFSVGMDKKIYFHQH
jgi:hypothetical protein